ncbi:MAG: hypothetical protein ABS46_00025 [Cytophagaceae bacterium SCN 52-12]|nr:MAG: hypothetical protein ABS46_00025 [Cytophagaceae bacterium SCN 52-12]
MKNKVVLLADKDESTRKILRDYLLRQPCSFLLKECGNGPEALRLINTIQPGLVIMEVMLPGRNSFEVLDALDCVPPVILMSATPEHAAKAFDYRVADYLMKPLAPLRIQCAFQRLMSLKHAPATGTAERAAGYPSRIFVEKGARLVGIPVDKITYLKADGDYTWIHTIGNEAYLCTIGIGQLEGKFDPLHFIRVHRSYIVNVAYIRELYRDISKLFVSLPNDVEISVGRSYLPAIKELMF